MANGACDICGRPATARVRASVNGKVQNMELCDQHYREMVRRSGRSASPLESLFGRHSLFDEFFGDSGFGSLFSDSPLRGGALGATGAGEDDVVDATFGEETPRRGSRRGGGRTIADRLSEQGNKLLQDAAQKAGEFGRSEVDTEHLLLALTSSDVVKTILEQFKVDVDDLRRQIEKEAKRGDAKTEGEIGVSPRLKDALNRAFIASNELGHSYVGPEHLLIGLAEEGEGLAAAMLRKLGLTPQALRQQVTKVVGKGAEEGRVETPSNTPDLDQFSRDLTKLAREGKLDPVIGRAREIETTIEVLARRKKNNPVLIGEPGVGKTAIVEGLAQRIVAGEVPEALRDKRLVELNINSMVAGSKYRGEFEERVQKILKEITEEKDSLILFIDEMHTIVGAGQGGGEGGLDIANTFKPALARGELNLIGATTLNEYQKYIEKDAALERRFQPVYVDEPTVAQTIMILRGLRDTLESHHKVTITDEAIIAAAELSDRYITGRFMPDKAIDLIDQAAARVKISATARPVDVQELEAEVAQIKREQDYAAARKQFDRAAELKKELEQKQKELDELLEIWKRDQASATAEVRADHVAQIVSKITGVPVTDLTTEEKDKLLKLEEKLHERVIGQEEAIRAVADAVRLARAGLREGSGPTATFLFLGPTGVGKTELAKTLAEVIFGDQDALIRIDMSEYGERHSVARLVGAPPGYVGYDEGGQLTEKVRRRPYSVVLLDEIEKAHPDLFNILLQVMDNGRLTDHHGKTVDFRNVVLIMTTNAGAADMARQGIGFGDVSKEDASEEAVKRMFTPEFRNRLDAIVPFGYLGKETVARVVDKFILQLELQLAEQNVDIQFDKDARAWLADKGYDRLYGARPMGRLIQEKIKQPLAEELLFGKLADGGEVSVTLKDGKPSFELTPAPPRAKRKSPAKKKAAKGTAAPKKPEADTEKGKNETKG